MFKWSFQVNYCITDSFGQTGPDQNERKILNLGSNRTRTKKWNSRTGSGPTFQNIGPIRTGPRIRRSVDPCRALFHWIFLVLIRNRSMIKSFTDDEFLTDFHSDRWVTIRLTLRNLFPRMRIFLRNKVSKRVLQIEFFKNSQNAFWSIKEKTKLQKRE